MQTPLIKQGWLRVVIFCIGLLAIAIGIAVLADQLYEIIDIDITDFSIIYIITSIGFIAFTWLMLKLVDRKKFKQLGFEWKNHKGEATIGFSTAIAMLGIGVLILILTGQIIISDVQFDPLLLTGQLLLMLIVAFTEEIVFRGYILGNLMQSFDKWIALIASALVFSLFHASNPGASVIPLINVFAAGLLLGINYIYTRNLWFGICLHFAWNFFQGPVLGFEVSGLDLTGLLQQYQTGNPVWTGGEFGFEGSALCTLLLLLFTALWMFLFNRKYT